MSIAVVNSVNPGSSSIDVNNQTPSNSGLDKLVGSENTKVSDMVNHALTSIDASHDFLKQMLNYTGNLDVTKLQQTQEAVEKFTVGSQLIAKTVSIVVKDIDTLTRIQ